MFSGPSPQGSDLSSPDRFLLHDDETPPVLTLNLIPNALRTRFASASTFGGLAWWALMIVSAPVSAAAAELRAGCSAIDVSPRVLPALRNGGFLEQVTDRVEDPLHCRAVVLSDGETTLAIAIVDSCMIPRDVCDAIKARVEKLSDLPPARVLIASTHTHSAPSVMSYTLGCRQDVAYTDYLIPRVAEGIAQAQAALTPAEAAWAVVDAPDHTHCRRWVHQPDAFEVDPFGDRTVRAMMHPGYQNPKYSGPSGPVDSGLTVLSLRSVDGKPLAVLANYSMHYFGGPVGFSADYFGDFARYLEEKSGDKADAKPKFVGIMSQGTSGDQHWMDYARPERKGYTRQQYARELGELTLAALSKAAYRRDVSLAMAESRLALGRRLPSAARLSWARKLNQARGDRRPQNLPEVYAEQAQWLHDNPRAELVLQAVRIGELGLTAIPNEVFGVTGLKLKAGSPLETTMNLELANGAEGYIPPPGQHYLGGYTTWPARTAGLEVEAEPKIVDALLTLLEQVSGGRKRRALPTELYSSSVQATIVQARRDDNNRENRGANAKVNPPAN